MESPVLKQVNICMVFKCLNLAAGYSVTLQLTASKSDLKKSQDELAKISKELESTKAELKKMKDSKVKLDETQKQLDALKKKSADVETEVAYLHLFDF